MGASQDIVSADTGRLQQVVWNLLTNAIKFTPKGGQVQVLLQRVNSHLELSVSDTGIGVPASYLPHVFDRFSQKDSSTTRAFGGLGLGLAICKQLVELHGGSIRAASQGEGKGATFSVHLPLSIVQLQEESSPRIHPTVLICDVGMPRTDGYQLIRTMRAEECRSERIPALALTAFAQAEDRKRSLVAGYQAHLAKPFDVGELILVVADLVGR